MTPQVIEKLEKFGSHFSGLLDVRCEILDLESNPPTLKGMSGPDSFCIHCHYENRNEFNTHMYGCHEAHRWNGKYTYYCPLGLVFIAASVCDNSKKLVGGIILGPMVMGDMQDAISELLMPSMAHKVIQLSSFTPKQVRHISEIFSSITAEISGVEHQRIKNQVYQQDRILNAIYNAKDYYSERQANAAVIIDFEKQLKSTVMSGDKPLALQLFNEMLGHIYYYCQNDNSALRARITELLVVLSRIAIEAGADPNEILSISGDFINEMDKLNDQDELNVWVSHIMHNFILHIFDLGKIKHSDVVFKVMEYIKKNCDNKLTLDSLARQVYLSKSYLSSIFKQETGVNLTAYITKIRIEKSKKMLMDGEYNLATIANRCGFEDQSYFTKVFKKEVGISPKKFRSNYVGYL